MLGRAQVLEEMKYTKTAIKQFDCLIRSFGASDYSDVRSVVVDALLHKADRLAANHHFEMSIIAYRKAVNYLREDNHYNNKFTFFAALNNLALTYKAMNQYHDALVTFNELVHEFCDIHEYEHRVAEARLLISNCWGALNRKSQEIMEARRLISQFGEVRVPGVQKIVAAAYFNIGTIFFTRGRLQIADIVFRDMIALFGSNELPAVREIVIKSMINRSHVLFEFDRPVDALDILDSIMAGSTVSDRSNVSTDVPQAFLNAGYIRRMIGANEEAVRCYETLIDLYGKHTGFVINRKIAVALYDLSLA